MVALWSPGQKIEMNRDKPAALRASDCLLDSKLLRKVKLVVAVTGRSRTSVSRPVSLSAFGTFIWDWTTRSLSTAATSCLATADS